MTAEFKNFRLIEANSLDIINLYPTPDFAQEVQLNQQYHRNLSGNLDTYKLANSSQYRYSVPVSFVSSSDRMSIESYYLSQTELIFTYGNTPSFNQIYVRIANNQHPLPVRSNQQFTKYNGLLRLHETRGTGVFSGSPFTLDDSILGLLDQSYNPLI